MTQFHSPPVSTFSVHYLTLRVPEIIKHNRSSKSRVTLLVFAKELIRFGIPKGKAPNHIHCN